MGPRALFTRRSRAGRTALVIALLWLTGIALAGIAEAQVLTPEEIKNPDLRALQERNFKQLQAAGAEIQGHIFPFPFYFSRVLDLELAQQERADQRSLRFDNYGGMTVVELTGNYFASYSTELVNKSHRALRTFQDVMLPILEILAPAFRDNPDVEGFAMEISHHIRGKSMGMNMEHPENLVLALSKDAAVRLVTGKSESDRQAALLDGHFYFNGEPFILYLSDQAAQDAARHLDTDDQASGRSVPNGKGTAPSPPGSRKPQRSSAPATPPRDTSPEALAKIQATDQKIVDLVVRQLDPQAHFVSYAPPAVVAFRKAAYLEFSVTTTLPADSAGSRYKLAALAFDDHVVHLVRPLMAYFKGDLDFDGIAFSTTLHQDDKPGAAQKKDDKPGGAQGAEAVEFFFPTDALRCYESYDCTGQELIDQGSVLIDGERVSLDLQIAESAQR